MPAVPLVSTGAETWSRREEPTAAGPAVPHEPRQAGAGVGGASAGAAGGAFRDVTVVASRLAAVLRRGPVCGQERVSEALTHARSHARTGAGLSLGEAGGAEAAEGSGLVGAGGGGATDGRRLRTLVDICQRQQTGETRDLLVPAARRRRVALPSQRRPSPVKPAAHWQA